MGKQAERKTVVLEALGMFAAKGATREDIFSLIEADLYGETVESKRKSLSNALGRLVNEYEEAELIGGRYYLKEHAPKTEKPVIRVDRHNQVAPYTTQAKGKRVSIFTSPIVLENVVALALCNETGWHKIPLFGSIRICIGRETPMWSPDQVTYTGINRIRLTHKDGSTIEETATSKDWITIAPEEN